ncbi:hypothetical protein HIC20_00705 [Buchnera aphidicola (Hormaphis cornu)]|nr:hypothetical protein HIC20_00705 [Buchnera aphidicola (Hormaphis cornu)]
MVILLFFVFFVLKSSSFKAFEDKFCFLHKKSIQQSFYSENRFYIFLSTLKNLGTDFSESSLKKLELNAKIFAKKTDEPYLKNILFFSLMKINLQKFEMNRINSIVVKRFHWILNSRLYNELGNLWFLKNEKIQAIKFWKKCFILEKHENNKNFEYLKINL